ncbi:hypothetical protein [Salinirubrum litoreum]|uniref:SH3 domain-containing protein n=1 Tax=Salinirubrum litoreum TaxID=1126234 RepID=A0ABD5RB69_9EURY|nr:hypothetical protein [Salinirubrum litoreum]
MRVVVRTTTESPADSTSADASSPDAGSTPADHAGSKSSTPGGNPAPPIGKSGTGTSTTGAGTTGADTAVVSDAEGTESRPSRVPAEDPITCHGFSEGEHGLKLTDADGEKCGYVPYAELLRIVPE